MTPARVSWKLRRTGDGYEGMVVLPASLAQCVRRAPGPAAAALRRSPTARRRIAVRARSKSPGGAIMKAAGVADALMQNPLIAAAMPPQAAVAVKALKFAGRAAKAGRLGKALGKMAGPGAKRLVKALKFW